MQTSSETSSGTESLNAVIRWLRVLGRGAGLIGLGRSPWSGVLVLGAAALLSPVAAAACAFGVAFGTVVARLTGAYSNNDWERGFSGYGPGIVGIIWSGTLSTGQGYWAFLLALCTVIALDSILIRRFGVGRYHPLASGSLIVGWISFEAVQQFGIDFWDANGTIPFGENGVYAAIGLIVVVLCWHSPRAGLLSAALAAFGGLLADWVIEPRSLFDIVGLWGFTIPPAVFLTQVILLRDARSAWRYAVLAGFIAAAIWFTWMTLVYEDVVTWLPLMAPAQLAAWAAVYLAYRISEPARFDTDVDLAVTAIRKAKRRSQRVLALTGAGISTNSGIPDYISGAWLDPSVPVSDYSFSSFLTARTARRNYWNAVSAFRNLAHAAVPSSGHKVLSEMQMRGWVDRVITQNVDRLHQAAGSDSVVNLHGTVDQVRCLSCQRTEDWPDGEPWHVRDLRCVSCDGLLKPGVTAMGEPLDPAVWYRAVALAEKAGVIMIVGTRLAVTSAVDLLALARKNGATVIVITRGATSVALEEKDIVLDMDIDQALSAIRQGLMSRFI